MREICHFGHKNSMVGCAGQVAPGLRLRVEKLCVGSASTRLVVMPGPDPGVHHSSKEPCEEDGLPGHLARRRASRFCPAMTSCKSSLKTSEVVMSEPLQIGLVIFPKVTQLDLTGPVQVFSSVPGAKVHLIWKRIEPVASDSVLTLTPTITFADCR